MSKVPSLMILGSKWTVYSFLCRPALTSSTIPFCLFALKPWANWHIWLMCVELAVCLSSLQVGSPLSPLVQGLHGIASYPQHLDKLSSFRQEGRLVVHPSPNCRPLPSVLLCNSSFQEAEAKNDADLHPCLIPSLLNFLLATFKLNLSFLVH